MPSLPQSVANHLDEGRAYPTLGRLIGGDEHDAERACGLAVAVLVDGLANLAAGPQGVGGAAIEALLDVHGRGPLDDLDGHLIKASAAPGNDIIDRVFGADRGTVVVGLASQLSLGSSVVGRLLPLVAPLVTAELARRRADDELDGEAVATLLADERQNLPEGLSTTAVLDAAAEDTAVLDAAAQDTAVLDAAAEHSVIDLNAEGSRGSATGTGSKAAAIGAAGIGSTGAVATLEETRSEAEGGSAVETEAGATASTTKGASNASADTKSGAGASEAGTGSIADVVLGEVGTESSSPMNWLWWAAGAVVLVLVLAWLLSTCNDGDTDGDGAATVVEVGEGGSGDSDGSDGTASAGDSTGDDSEGPDVEAELQALVDEALAGTGAVGTVDGTDVTLTGAVDSEAASAEAEEAVSELLDVGMVENRLTVDDDGAMGGATAGETLNDLLELDAVSFAISSSLITPAGEAVLDQVIEFLDEFPAVNIEIGGHTDSDGSEVANLDLSRRRAQAVLDHLVDGGIEADRLVAEGYGEAEPKVANSNDANKAINRRIEFTVAES